MKKFLIYILPVLSILVIAFGVFWLGLVLLILGGLVILFTSKITFVQAFKKKKWLVTMASLMMIFVVAIFIRLFVFEIYEIPSGSMESTLEPGDKILVNKLYYGPELPRSPFEIPWVNLVYYSIPKARAAMDSIWWPSKRLNGFTKLKGGDVVVFNAPWKSETVMIKRCVATPGEQIAVEQGVLKVNDERPAFDQCENIRKRYNIYVAHDEAWNHLVEQLELEIPQFRKIQDRLYMGNLDKKLKQQLESMTITDSLVLKIHYPDPKPQCFPKSKDFNWSVDCYGPISIPYRNQTIAINDTSYTFYRGPMKQMEGEIIKRKKDQFYINDSIVTNYCFKHDYYFMMGDNRDYSRDSRYWGMISDEKIIGKATHVLWSYKDGKMKWKRMLKRIR